MKWKIFTLFCLAALFARPAQAQVNVPIPPLPKVDVSGPYLWGLWRSRDYQREGLR